MRVIRRIGDALTRRPDLVVWLIALYYLLAIGLRVLRSGAAENDEAEQLFQSQFLLMGYGPQPPFFNWLQYGVIQLVGPSILALSLLKNLLLLATCLVYGLAARVLLKDGKLTAIAMLGVIAMPAVSVMAQRDLTHAIATLFAVALFTYAFVKTLTRPNLGLYLLTGVAVGLGLISKYNFVVLPVAAILAILPDPELRKRVFDWRFLAALAVAVAICLPHGIWAFSNLADATSTTIESLRKDASGDWFADRIEGLVKLVLAALAGGLPVVGFFLIAFRRSLIEAWNAKSLWTGVIGRMFLFSLLLIGLISVGLGATTISEKWLSPFLLLLPLYLCLKLQAAEVDIGDGVARMFFPVMALALGFALYMGASNLAAPYTGRYEKENFPGGPFLEKVLADHGDAAPAYVIVDDFFLAASARMQIPGARVLLPGSKWMPFLTQNERARPGLVVWRSRSGEAGVPIVLRPFLRASGILPDTLSVELSNVPYLYSGGRASVAFSYAWVAPN